MAIVPTKIMDALFSLVADRRRTAFGPAQHSHGPACSLPCACYRKNTLVAESARNRTLTQGLMGECHFHDTPFTVTCITQGKSAVQPLLAEVNGLYDLSAPVVPFREVATENWCFSRFGFMGCVK
jgi:hypothetical protein